MKLKFYITFVICLITFSSIAVSKITDPRARADLYDGCIKQYVASSNFSKREFSKYCSCTADSVMEKFTSKEMIVHRYAKRYSKFKVSEIYDKLNKGRGSGNRSHTNHTLKKKVR